LQQGLLLPPPLPPLLPVPVLLMLLMLPVLAYSSPPRSYKW
jgi:hypothetical protein